MTQTGTAADDSERELVKRILSGDNSAFAELIVNNQRLVFNITSRIFLGIFSLVTGVLVSLLSPFA